VPRPGDLPGGGWVAVDEPSSGPAAGEAELIDCVGPDFPGVDDTVASAASPHFVRPPHQLVHGLAVMVRTPALAERAATILRHSDFARCLGRSVAADLVADPGPAELLDVDVRAVAAGSRVTFTGASSHGVRPIHLDIAVLSRGPAVSVLWFADTPEPFPPTERRHVIERVQQRLDAPLQR
jgi:hypothetical protein